MCSGGIRSSWRARIRGGCCIRIHQLLHQGCCVQVGCSCCGKGAICWHAMGSHSSKWDRACDWPGKGPSPPLVNLQLRDGRAVRGFASLTRRGPFGRAGSIHSEWRRANPSAGTLLPAIKKSPTIGAVEALQTCLLVLPSCIRNKHAHPVRYKAELVTNILLQQKRMQLDANNQPETTQPSKPKRDWFGYIFTTVIGVGFTFLIAWYQLYSSQRDAAAAEIEKARSVRQAAVAIIEEHVLNSKTIEVERLTRLIEQRRRDEAITIPIPVSEVVELAEFAIASSRHLSIDKKEEVKPIFDNFYSEVKSRSFKPFNEDNQSSPLLNEVAKNIQDGRASEALAGLHRLDEVHKQELSEAQNRAIPSFTDAFFGIFDSPLKSLGFLVFIIIYFLIARILARKFQYYREYRRNSLERF